MQTNRKYCPRCGALIHAGDAYCIRCGYSFRARKGIRFDLKTIIIAVAIILGLWVVVRVVTKQPIIPSGLADIFKGIGSSKAG